MDRQVYGLLKEALERTEESETKLPSSGDLQDRFWSELNRLKEMQADPFERQCVRDILQSLRDIVQYKRQEAHWNSGQPKETPDDV